MLVAINIHVNRSVACSTSDIKTSIDPTDDEQLFPNINFKPVFLKKGFKRDDPYSDGIPHIIHQVWKLNVIIKICKNGDIHRYTCLFRLKWNF